MIGNKLDSGSSAVVWIRTETSDEGERQTITPVSGKWLRLRYNLGLTNCVTILTKYRNYILKIFWDKNEFYIVYTFFAVKWKCQGKSLKRIKCLQAAEHGPDKMTFILWTATSPSPPSASATWRTSSSSPTQSRRSRCSTELGTTPSTCQGWTTTGNGTRARVGGQIILCMPGTGTITLAGSL